jgi:hypothetical protein
MFDVHFKLKLMEGVSHGPAVPGPVVTQAVTRRELEMQPLPAGLVQCSAATRIRTVWPLSKSTHRVPPYDSRLFVLSGIGTDRPARRRPATLDRGACACEADSLKVTV